MFCQIKNKKTKQNKHIENAVNIKNKIDNQTNNQRNRNNQNRNRNCDERDRRNNNIRNMIW